MESDRVNRWLMFASNIGVLIGLIFVGVEVRNSGNAVTAQAATAISEGYNHFNYLVATDPDVARLLYLGAGAPDKLTDSESFRANFLFRGLFNHYFQVHKLYTAGILTESEWALYASEINMAMRSPGIKIFLDGSRAVKSEIVDEFVKDVMRYETEFDEFDYTQGRGEIDFE